MILDAHCHAWQAWPYPQPAPAGTVGDAADLLAQLDVHGVDHALIVAAELGAEPGHVRNNEWVAACVTQYPARLSMVADLDSHWSPDYHQPGVLERFGNLEDLPLVGVTHYLAEEVDDWFERPEVGMVLDALCERALLLSLHAPGSWHGILNRVLSRWPDLRILLHHGGLARKGHQDSVLDLAAHHGVFVKISGPYYLTQGASGLSDWTRAWQPILQTYGADRVLWGSDYPVCTRRGYSYSQMLDVPAHLRLPDADHAAVLGGTAARLIRGAAS